ncbi:MAG TPA: histidine kinase N-terminal 7TM domain-containing protein [Actinomycetes bacterium]|nr:histidine kinase N-terminal 7TM domain-containing protein [Actinomycetes bacterium]
MVQQPRVAPGILAAAAAWHWTGVGLAMLATTAVFVAMAVYVWRRRGGSAGVALSLVLLALLIWAGAYAAELGAADLPSMSRWGDLKYVGLVLLPPAWFAFAALFAGRRSWVNWRNLALLAIHPVVVLVLLANEATHDLIRYYPREAALDPDAVAEPGPLFWPHLVYSGVVMWGSLILMVSALLRASRIYRRVATLLIVSLIVPYGFNLLYNFDVGPFGRVDLTPFLLMVSCLVLVWGLFRFRLLGIRPVARGLVFETISEAVVVLDPLHRVVDANPPAERLLGRALADAVGHPLAELLPEAAEAVRDPPTASNGASGRLAEELVITRGGKTQRYEPTVVAMPDRQGPPIGWLMVLRDVTEHHRTLRSLRQADEQRRSLLERVVTSQEEERRQVAGDIHDDAIQAMVAVTLQLQALGGRLHDPRSTELIERLAATATESVGRLRQLVFELRPPLLDEVGLAAAIDQYARRAGELAGFVVQVSDESAGELPGELRVVAYRIVQEALANVRAHARASRVAVRLEEVDGGVLARVSDDGIGFLPGLVDRRPAGHLGLISMREQAAMAGGWCRIASAPGMGTTVELWLPRPKEAAG